MKAIRFVILWLIGVMSHFSGLVMLTGSVLYWHVPSIFLGLAGVFLGFVSLLFTSSHDRARFWAFALPAAVTTGWLALSFFLYYSFSNPSPRIAADPELGAHFQQQAQQAPATIVILALGAIPLVIAALIFQERVELARKKQSQMPPSDSQP